MKGPVSHAEVADRPWGGGRKVGRTIYARARPDGKPSAEDVLFGMLDDPETVQHVSDLHNRWLQRTRQGAAE